MKRNEFKKILKPLIKECIKEVLFEEGVLSGVISEVVKGTQQTQLRRSSTPKLQEQKERQKNLERKKQAHQKYEIDLKQRKKLLNAVGINNVDVFEGTEPLSNREGLNESVNAPQGPLAGVSADDAGIDISGILAVGSGHNWQRLAKGE